MKHSYTPGDIVIGKFKYTDKDDFKVRNFLIIATPHPFVWGLMMSKSSSISQDDGSLYELSKSDIDFTPPATTGIRMNVIQTIDVSVIHKKIGKASEDCLDRVLNYVKSVLPN